MLRERACFSGAVYVWVQLFVVIVAGPVLGVGESVAQQTDSVAVVRLHSVQTELTVTAMVDGQREERVAEFSVDSVSVLVPEGRTGAATRSIEIPAVRIRATGDSVSLPVFWLGGGPGQSNLTTFNYDDFVERHDHVMVGYRGVDGPVSLECHEVVETLKRVDDVLSAEALQETKEAFERCRDRLVADDVNLDGYTILEVVHDVDVVRRALGYDRIHLVAESFGTRIAYLYALVYPESVDRMILIGAQPPGGMVWDPAQSDRILGRYDSLWKADEGGAARSPSLEEALRSVNRDMPDRWLFLPIHPGNVKTSSHAMLFHRESAAKVFDAYLAAARGDASGLWLISFVTPFIVPHVVNWGENASKAVSADYDPTVDYVATLLPDDGVMGAPLGAFLWAPAEVWPIKTIPDSFRTAGLSEVETLLLSGNLDLTTPSENVDTGLMPYLPNATHVVMSDFGHIMDLWNLQPDATHRLLTTFLATGRVDVSGISYQAMDFDVRWGFPLLAKLLVGGIAASACLLGLALWWIIRRLRRRRP